MSTNNHALPGVATAALPRWPRVRNIDRATALQALYWGLLVCIVAVYSVFYIQTISLDIPTHGIYAQLNMTASKPFIYRILTFVVLRVLASVIPVQVGMWFIACSSLLTAMVTVYTTARQYVGKAGLFAPLLLLVAVVVLWFGFTPHMLYDMPQLALFSLAYLAMLRNRKSYFFVFALACFNKETAALLTIGYAALHWRRMAAGPYMVSIALQVAIWRFVRITVVYLFRDNPGTDMMIRMYMHLRAITRLPGVVAIYLLLAAGVIAVMAHRWLEKPLGVRRMLVATAPLLMALYIVGGYPFEFRVFYELVPLVVVLCLPPAGVGGCKN